MTDDPDAEVVGTGFWVVGVDGSAGARHAAMWAARQAPGRARLIRVAAAWNVPNIASISATCAAAPTWDTGEIADSAAAEADSVAMLILDDLGEYGVLDRRVDNRADHRVAAPIRIEPVIGQGQPSSVLLDASSDASLLVLGSRGHGGFRRLVLGSTSTQCATHSSRPTAIVPARASLDATHRILVGFDGSENSRTALDWAMEFATDDCVIDCVMIWDSTPIVVGADQFFFPEASDLARERFAHLVDQAEQEETDRRGGHAAPPIVRHFVVGRPRNELARMAPEADLVVVGARGHGAVGAAILGSVSTWLLHHADEAVVVVPHPDETGSRRTGHFQPH